MSAIEQPPPRTVYFVQANTLRLIKIGIAIEAVRRLRELGMTSPDRLTALGTMQCWDNGLTELRIHERFATERRHGEWFEPSDRLIRFIGLNAITHERWLAKLQDALDAPAKPKGRRPVDLANLKGTRTVNRYVKTGPKAAKGG